MTINNPNKWLFAGLACVVFTFMSACILFTTSTPLLGLSDTSLHLDYSWQVYHGDLPDFYTGMEAPIEVKKPPVHFVSQHPPLYYALLAPVTGPLIDGGHWRMAAFVGSVITMLLGTLCVLGFAVAGWYFGGSRKKQFSLIVPALLAPSATFIIASSSIFNDTPALLASILSLAVLAAGLKNGFQTKHIVLLAFLTAIGMGTRAGYVATLIVVVVSIFGQMLLVKKRDYFKKDLIKAIVSITTIILPALLLTGWFYYRNIQLSGSWTEAAPSTWAQDTLGRSYKSLQTVLADPNLWTLVPRGVYGLPLPGLSATASSSIFSMVVFIYCLAVLVINVLRDNLLKSINRSQKLMYLSLILLCALMFGQQILHSVGYGGLNMRYLLPVLLPIGLVFAYSLLKYPRYKITLLTIVVIGGWISFYTSLVYLITKRWQSINPAASGVELMKSIAEYNHLNSAIIVVAMATGLVGILGQVYCISKLAKD